MKRYRQDVDMEHWRLEQEEIDLKKAQGESWCWIIIPLLFWMGSIIMFAIYSTRISMN